MLQHLITPVALVVAMVAIAHGDAGGALDRSPQRAWAFMDAKEMLQRSEVATREEISDDDAAIWGGLICGAEDAQRQLAYLLPQVQKSRTVRARNVEFLVTELAAYGDMESARKIADAHAERFQSDYRYGYMQLLLETRKGEGWDPKDQIYLRGVATKLFALLDRKTLADDGPFERDPFIVSELERHRDCFRDSEMLNVSALTNAYALACNLGFGELYGGAGRYADFVLPNSAETKQQLIELWIGGLARDLKGANLSWLTKAAEQRGITLDWEFLATRNLAEAMKHQSWREQRMGTLLLLACSSDSGIIEEIKFPFLVECRKYFAEKRPELAVLAGLALSRSKDAAHRQYFAAAVEALHAMPTPPKIAVWNLAFIVWTQGVLHDPNSDAASRDKLVNATADILEAAALRDDLDSPFRKTLGELLVRTGRWDRLFSLWEKWADDTDSLDLALSIAVPWLTVGGEGQPWWLKAEVRALVKLAGMEEGGNEEEAAYLKAAGNVKHPWLRIMLLSWISSTEMQRAMAELAALANQDFLTCITLADWSAERSVERQEWLSRAESLADLAPSEQKAVDLRRVLWPLPAQWEGDKRLPPSQMVLEALKRLENAELDATEWKWLVGACESMWAQPELAERLTYVHPTRVAYYEFAGTPQFLRSPDAANSTPTPEAVRTAVRDRFLRSISLDTPIPASLFYDQTQNTKLSEAVAAMVQKVVDRSPLDRYAAVHALLTLGKTGEALVQLRKLLESHPDKIFLHQSALYLALKSEPKLADSIHEQIPVEFRRKILCELAKVPSEVKATKHVLQEISQWQNLTDQEAAVLLHLCGWNKREEALPIASRLLDLPATAAAAWKKVVYETEKRNEGIREEIALYARRVILADPAGGMVNGAPDSAFYDDTLAGSVFARYAIQENNPHLLAALCKELEEKQHPRAAHWRVREALAFAPMKERLRALNRLAESLDDAMSATLFDEIHFFLRSLTNIPGEKRELTDLTVLRKKMWQIFRRNPQLALAQLIAVMHYFDRRPDLWLDLYLEEAHEFLLPPAWVRETVYDWAPRTEFQSGLVSDPASVGFIQRWLCYQELSQAYASEMKWTWRVLPSWREQVFVGVDHPWDTSGALDTGGLLYQFSRDDYHGEPEETKLLVQFLKESPCFGPGDYLDPVIELESFVEPGGGDPFAESDKKSVRISFAAQLILTVQGLTPNLKMRLADALRAESNWKGFGISLLFAALEGKSPAAAFSELGASPDALAGQSWVDAEAAQRFLRHELSQVFPKFEEELAKDAAALKIWQSMLIPPPED